MGIGASSGWKEWKFPGGEIGVKVEGNPRAALIKLDGRVSSDDIMTALNLIDAFYRAGADDISLYIPYFPYARQDRVCSIGESFALEVMVKVLASQADKISKIFVDDVHSSVFRSLCSQYMPKVPISESNQASVCIPSIENRDYDFLVGPDKGSTEKVKLLSERINVPYVTLDKRRAGGEIQYAPLQSCLYGKVLVVDDICDGGATFLALAKMLRETQADITKLDLYVTHGIFSKGLEALKSEFDGIYFFNDMRS